MIKTYQFINTIHFKLHEYVISFFKKIEKDSNGFRDELFEPDFLPIVKRHKKILQKKFKSIYKEFCILSQNERTAVCQMIINSNKIEEICQGKYTPKTFKSNLSKLEIMLKELFIDLYEKVLDGKPFFSFTNKTLRDHFNQFCDINKDITLCPFCGISELKKSLSRVRDQYDHYLPKSIYPLSSVNFLNLVPCCSECNSLQVKGDKDVIELSSGKLFFPYNNYHNDIILKINIKKDNALIENIIWEIDFFSLNSNHSEISSWNSIYCIEDRYKDYINARILKWYNHYFDFKTSPQLRDLSEEQKQNAYEAFLLNDENQNLSFIRNPVINSLLSDSDILNAHSQSKEYI